MSTRSSASKAPIYLAVATIVVILLGLVMYAVSLGSSLFEDTHTGMRLLDGDPTGKVCEMVVVAVDTPTHMTSDEVFAYADAHPEKVKDRGTKSCGMTDFREVER